jgi:asparagine synthase (glutamine-hydrolysing)
MVSASGRFVIAFNGLIYNYLLLRRELEEGGYPFLGECDTEVLVAAVERWGVQRALQRCNGMLAVAVWDRRERRLALARDRFGEKPLYYGWAGDSFVFASELKAIRRHPGFRGQIDRGALALYLRHNCVPAPHSIFRGFAKVPPGSLVWVSDSTLVGTLPEPTPYWSLRDVATEANGAPPPGSVGSALEVLDATLGDAVRMRMHADVPLGAFLSGGIDSSLVVSLMQSRSASKVRTFTISFEESAFDEAADARRVAGHLGTEHSEMVVTAADALGVVPELAHIYDEPFADSSQVPTVLLSRLTRQHVTVALSGDGGDELFGGYNRYVFASRYWDRLRRLPPGVRRGAARAVSAVPPRWWDVSYDHLERFLPASWRVRMPSLKVAKIADVLPSAGPSDLYRTLCSHFEDPGQIVVGGSEPPSLLTSPELWPEVAEPVQLMQYLDSMTYLPDDILTKVDRATMAASLEARVPFLDPAVAALSWRLPLDWKVRDGAGKWLLRQLLHRYVPPALVERPKMGFGIPLGPWLRGPLRGWASGLLSPQRLRHDGFFDPGSVERIWSDHLEGRRDRAYELWDLLMFQSWLDEWSYSKGSG